MKLCKENLQVNVFRFTQGIFDIYCPSEDMADFLNSQGKLGPLTSSFIHEYHYWRYEGTVAKG